jgi:hypothetical protein
VGPAATSPTSQTSARDLLAELGIVTEAIALDVRLLNILRLPPVNAL